MKKMTLFLAALLAVLLACGFSGGTAQRDIAPAMTEKQMETTELPKETEAGEVNGGIFYIVGSSEGLAELDQLLENAAVYGEYGKEGDVSALNVSAEFNGTILEAKIAVKDGKLDLMFPGLTDECYEFDMESLKEEAEYITGKEEDENGLGGILSSLNIFEKNKVKALLVKYGLKLTRLVSFRSLDWESGDYTLSQLGETLPCALVTVKPSREQWEDTLTSILTSALEDDTLREVMEQILRKSYAQSAFLKYDGDEDEFVEEYMDNMYESIDEALDSIDTIVDNLEGMTCTAVLNEGRLCSVRISKGKNGLAYEGYGDVENERRDVVYLFNTGDEGEENAMLLIDNSMTLHKNDGSILTAVPFAGVTAKMWYDLLDEENPEINGLIDAGTYQFAVSVDLQDKGSEAYAGLYSEDTAVQLFLHQEEQHVDVEFPQGEKTVISSIADLIGLAGTMFISPSEAE